MPRHADLDWQEDGGIQPVFVEGDDTSKVLSKGERKQQEVLERILHYHEHQTSKSKAQVGRR